MLDLTDLHEGVGSELTELRAMGALMLGASGSRSTDYDPTGWPELNNGDIEKIGWTLRKVADRIENRLSEIDKAHHREEHAA